MQQIDKFFKEADVDGLILKLKIPYNQRRQPFHVETNAYMKFGVGSWFAKEMAEQLEILLNPNDPDLRPMLIKSGAWYQFNIDGFTDKVQGQDKVVRIIEENEDFFQSLHKTNMETIYGANYNYQACA